MYEALDTENERLLWHLARRYTAACRHDRAVDVEDLVQAGFFGPVKAKARFDESKGKSWASWAAWHIKREFENALHLHEGRITRAYTGAASLDRPAETEDGTGETLAELLPDERLPEVDEAILRAEFARSVRARVDALPELQREAVRRVKLDGKTYKQAGRDMGMPLSRVYKLCQKGMRTLAQDGELYRLAEIDARTKFHAHKGVKAFQSDHTSVVETAVMWRERQMARLMRAQAILGEIPAVTNAIATIQAAYTAMEATEHAGKGRRGTG